ncbi:hypothetical protein BDZ85DRAFT_233593 [Elsinoe ampelina]|uniref:Alpha-1,2-mannosyltransferase n=1 Tax=Elsinoe ampelina TaxID=302913 RepID=A0A6A6GHF0_9PEZI|nr:hypothetical protein BDZ85DRAFT_233593 [Elsinoe ampelina]
MSSSLILLIWVPFVFVSLLYLVLSKRPRGVIYDRFHNAITFKTHTQPVDTKATPPLSDKLTELQRAFPPERLSSHSNQAALIEQRLHALQDPSNCVPDDQNVFDEKYHSRLTPTGFSMFDIKALGDFPDYAKLSGVPLPTSYPAFDIDRALPRPYRPFRWAYHQTMSLTKLDPDWWLELESTYRQRITQRLTLYTTHGSSVLQSLPGSELACKELMELALLFLTTRYPHYFTLTSASPSSRPTHFHNHILSTTTNLLTTPPLLTLLHNIPEDFALMLRSPSTGAYHFRAGIICSSLGWTLGTKISLPLSAIHAPVPDYAAKMAMSMDRFFSRMPCDRPIQRGSWGLEKGTPLYLPPEDEEMATRGDQDPALGVEDVNLRVDWQTLRRLPLSGAVCFNFKAVFTPLEEMRDEPGVPALVRRILEEGKRGIMEYKGTKGVEHVVLPVLEEWEREQVEKGMVDEGWEVGTLGEAPFYEGWRARWEGRQGFAAP